MSCNSLLANVVCFTCTTLNKVLSYLILSYLILSYLILSHMNFKNKSLEGTEQIYHPMAICQSNIEGQSTTHEHQQGANTIVDAELQYLCNEEHIPWPKHCPTSDADNVLYKYTYINRNTDGLSKRTSYERLNKDTMELHDRI